MNHLKKTINIERYNQFTPSWFLHCLWGPAQMQESASGIRMVYRYFLNSHHMEQEKLWFRYIGEVLSHEN